MGGLDWRINGEEIFFVGTCKLEFRIFYFLSELLFIEVILAFATYLRHPFKRPFSTILSNNMHFTPIPT